MNKDHHNEHSIFVNFHDAASGDHYFQNGVSQITFGPDQYSWHADGANGYAKPDGPALNSTEAGGKGVEYVLPRASVVVLRGTVR